MYNRADYLRLWRSYLGTGKQAYKKYKRSDGEFTDKYRVTLSNFQEDDNVFYFLAESQGGGTPTKLYGKEFYTYYYELWLKGKPLQVWSHNLKSWCIVTEMPRPELYSEGSHFIFKLRKASRIPQVRISVSLFDGLMSIQMIENKTKENKMKDDIFETMTNCTVKIEKSPEKEVAVKQNDLEAVVKYQAVIFDDNGMSVGTASFSKKKEAVAFVKRPENLGKTVVLFKRCCSLTTDVPVVEAD